MKMHERVHHRCGNRVYMSLVLMNILRDVDRITMHLFSLWNCSTLNNIIVILLLLVHILSLGNYEGSFLNRLLMVWWNRADYTNFVVVYAWAVIVQEWSRRINSPWRAAVLGQLNWYYLILHIAFLFFDTAEPIGCRTSEMSVRDVQVWLVALSRVVMVSSHMLHHLVVALLAHVPTMSWLISMWASEVWWIHVHIVEVLIHIVTWDHGHMWISWVLLLLLLVFLNLFSFFIFALLLLIQILLTTFGSLFANELARLSLGHHLSSLDGILRRLFWWFGFLEFRLGALLYLLIFDLGFLIIESSDLDVLEVVSFLHFHELASLEWSNSWDGWVYLLSAHEGACGVVGIVDVLLHGSRGKTNIWRYFSLALNLHQLLFDVMWRNGQQIVVVCIFRFWGQQLEHWDLWLIFGLSLKDSLLLGFAVLFARDVQVFLGV